MCHTLHLGWLGITSACYKTSTPCNHNVGMVCLSVHLLHAGVACITKKIGVILRVCTPCWQQHPQALLGIRCSQTGRPHTPQACHASMQASLGARCTAHMTTQMTHALVCKHQLRLLRVQFLSDYNFLTHGVSAANHSLIAHGLGVQPYRP